MNKSIYIVLAIILIIYLVAGFFYFRGGPELEISTKGFANESAKEFNAEPKTGNYTNITEYLTLRPEKSSGAIPLISLNGWQTLGPFSNPENCGEKRLFINQRPVYCKLAGLTDSYSVFWRKIKQNQEQKKQPSSLFPNIVVSVFEFSTQDSANSENVVKAHNVHLKFLRDFELQGITVKRQEFKYGIRLFPEEEKEKLSKEEIDAKTIRRVSYFDVFTLKNFVFVVSFDSEYENEAKTIEKAIIEKSKVLK